MVIGKLVEVINKANLFVIFFQYSVVGDFINSSFDIEIECFIKTLELFEDWVSLLKYQKYHFSLNFTKQELVERKKQIQDRVVLW